MSDSDGDIPSAAAIADGIRDIVISIHKAGNDDDRTVNHVRSGAEKKLGLPSGYLKNSDWKDKSKNLIKEAVVCIIITIGPVRPNWWSHSPAKLMQSSCKADLDDRTDTAATNLHQTPVRRNPPKRRQRQNPSQRRRPKRQPPAHRVRRRGKQRRLRKSLRNGGRLQILTMNQRPPCPIHLWSRPT